LYEHMYSEMKAVMPKDWPKITWKKVVDDTDLRSLHLNKENTVVDRK